MEPAAPSGPPGHWLWGNLLEQRRDPIGLLMRGLHEHGDVVRYRFGPYSALQLNHPRDIKHVLVDNTQAYHKWGNLLRAAPLLGQGLFLSEGELWSRQRALYQPAFHRSRLSRMLEEMVAATEDLIATWERLPDGALVSVSEACMRLTLSIGARTLISTDVGGYSARAGGDARRIAEAFEITVQEVGERMLSLNPYRGLSPTLRNLAFRRALARLDARVARVIQERRRAPHTADDLLTMLMAAKDERTGARMSDRQLRDEIMTILLTGRGPSGNGLIWMFLLIHQHPEIEARLRAEAQAVLGGGAPTLDGLQKLEITTRAFQEALRLYPPAWTIARQAIQPDVLRDVPVRPRTVILMSPYVVHRHPKLWDDPERFDPDRFLPERAAGRPQLSFIPFGAGPRVCVGMAFAMMEAKIIVSMLLQRFRFSLPAGTVAEPEPLVTLKPKNGLWMRLHHLPSGSERARPSPLNGAPPAVSGAPSAAS